MDLKLVTLDRIAEGAIPELFERELAAVLDNIDDPNTEAAKERRITITIGILPNATRDTATVGVTVKSKLESARPAGGAMFIGREKGAMAAYTKDPAQEGIEFPDGTGELGVVERESKS